MKQRKSMNHRETTHIAIMHSNYFPSATEFKHFQRRTLLISNKSIPVVHFMKHILELPQLYLGIKMSELYISKY
jgi:hypothetical protein